MLLGVAAYFCFERHGLRLKAEDVGASPIDMPSGVTCPLTPVMNTLKCLQKQSFHLTPENEINVVFASLGQAFYIQVP